MKKLIALLILVAALVGGWYFASPWMAMNGLRTAMLDRDVDALKDRIDFDAVRASIVPQIEERARGALGEGGLGGLIGSALSGPAANLVAKQLATPEGLGVLLTAGAAATSIIPEDWKAQDVEWDVERDGFSRFRGVGVKEDGTPSPTLIFERDGVRWEVVGVELP